MAVVYKISCLDESIKESYVGSTVNFKKRIGSHKRTCHNENSNEYNYPLYKFIRENGGWRAWEMTIIDSLTTTDKNEKEKCERRYIEEQEFSLNKFIPTRSRKEYHQDNKEKLNEISRKYHQANREEINENMKQYYQANREEINENMKQYREANRETISKQKNEKVACERCGAFSVRSSLRRHQRSNKCMNAN